MKTTSNTSGRGSRSAVGSRKSLEIQVITSKKEVARFDELLKDKHYIGKAQPTGDFLRQVAVLDEQWVGLFAWGAACYSIKDRDQWIGWSNTQRAERQKLVVQNRRFLSLLERGKHPNQASRMLGAAVRMLPEQWEKQFGYRPVLAETFTDIEQFAGTCCKASGWEPVGMSKGYGRHRGEFYVRHDRPKKLWMKKLQADALKVLCAAELAVEHQAGGRCNAHGVTPLKMAQSRSLMEALQLVPDPRAKNNQLRIGSILSIVVMALLSEWLGEHHGSLPGALALDGKMIRQTIGVVSLVDQETEVPVAMKLMSQKEGEGERCEMKVGEKILAYSTSKEISGPSRPTCRAAARTANSSSTNASG